MHGRVYDFVAPSADPALDELLERRPRGASSGTTPDGDDEPIRRAGRAAIELAHAGQLRRTGEHYVTHPVAVALTSRPTSASTQRPSRRPCCTTPSRTPA